MSEWILSEGRHHYLCVPKGQVTEGYLVLAPYSCHDPRMHRGCLAHLSTFELQEMAELQELVRHFFSKVMQSLRRHFMSKFE